MVATRRADFEFWQCGVISNVAPGDYTVGQVPVQGYEGSVSCQTAFPPGEMFAGQTAFTHGVTGFPTVCTITNLYRKSQVTITQLVVNDDIGTSGSDDFTAELFRAGRSLSTGSVPPTARVPRSSYRSASTRSA
jgi:hypothetical protein